VAPFFTMKKDDGTPFAKARAKRMSVPEVLLSSEIQALLGQLDASSGLMVTLAVTTGLRAVSSLHCVGGT